MKCVDTMHLLMFVCIIIYLQLCLEGCCHPCFNKNGLGKKSKSLEIGLIMGKQNLADTMIFKCSKILWKLNMYVHVKKIKLVFGWILTMLECAFVLKGGRGVVFTGPRKQLWIKDICPWSDFNHNLFIGVCFARCSLRLAKV